MRRAALIAVLATAAPAQAQDVTVTIGAGLEAAMAFLEQDVARLRGCIGTHVYGDTPPHVCIGQIQRECTQARVLEARGCMKRESLAWSRLVAQERGVMRHLIAQGDPRFAPDPAGDDPLAAYDDADKAWIDARQADCRSERVLWAAMDIGWYVFGNCTIQHDAFRAINLITRMAP